MNPLYVREHGFDLVFVFAGDGYGLAAYGDEVRRDERRFGDMDQVGAVNAEEILAQEILPLADAGSVAVAFA